MSWETVLWSLVPTPGHTAGSMARLIRRPERSQLVLVGDLTSGAELLGRGQLPGVGVRSQLVETIRKVPVVKRPMPDLVACRHTIRPPPSGCWKAEAGASQ
jgi:glyoxylase-like metal-dependent hydrolase (beta-lactamase superfamily II)